MFIFKIPYIKRSCCIFVAAAISIFSVFSFSSCIIRESDYLFYQNYPFSVTADIIIDSFECSIKAELSGPYSGSITYLSPDTLKDIEFSSGDDGVFISYNNLKIPVSPKSDADFLIFLLLFSLDKTQFSGAEIIDDRSGKLNLAVFKTDIGTVNVYIDPISGLPVKFSAELYGRSIEATITGFEFGEKTDVTDIN